MQPTETMEPDSAAEAARGAGSWWRRVADTLEFIKFSHTVFALPFALVAMLAAAGGVPEFSVVGWILVCMVSARTAAMGFNRWADWDWDQANPRTRRRAALGTRGLALALTLGGAFGLVGGAWALNPLCGFLSPVALAMVLGYSWTKRFTAYSHFFLGLALAAAPMGAWGAVTGSLLDGAPWVLAGAVLLWVFGFDLIYATQDVDFDRAAGLHSFPARYGIPAALQVAGLAHAATWLLLAAFGWLVGFGMAYWASLAVVSGALAYEHRLSRMNDLARINLAFFHMNALVGLALLLGAWISLL
jgi:4-hydroxybenzoate polyprenyltransferase